MSLGSVAFAWGREERPCVVVADEHPSSRSTVRRLARKLSDIDLVVCSDGAQALFECGRLSPAAVVLSASLPVVAAADVVAVLANHREQLGTIAVAVAEGETECGAAVLAAGANRLFPRPYGARDIESLVMRDLGALEGAQRRPTVLQAGALRLDWPAFRVTVDGEQVPLTLREFEILSVLLRHVDKVVPHALLQQEFGRMRGQVVRSNTLAVHVRRLRGHVAGAVDIVAIRGVGYRLSVAGQDRSRRPGCHVVSG